MSGIEIGKYSVDDDLIESCLSNREAALKVYIPESVSVVLGRGSKPDIELNLENCIADKIPIWRRGGGGCAVVLDPGNVIVSLVLPTDGLGKINDHFDSISSWLIDGLKKVGLDGVHRAGTSDLAVGDRKIAGACMERKRNYVFYSTSLLFEPNFALMEKYLKHPPREPIYRRNRSHFEFVVRISDLVSNPSILAFENALRLALSPTNQVKLP